MPRSVSTTRTVSRRCWSSEVQASIRVDVEVFTSSEVNPVARKIESASRLREVVHSNPRLHGPMPPGVTCPPHLQVNGRLPGSALATLVSARRAEPAPVFSLDGDLPGRQLSCCGTSGCGRYQLLVGRRAAAAGRRHVPG